MTVTVATFGKQKDKQQPTTKPSPLPTVIATGALVFVAVCISAPILIALWNAGIKPLFFLLLALVIVLIWGIIWCRATGRGKKWKHPKPMLFEEDGVLGDMIAAEHSLKQAGDKALSKKLGLIRDKITALEYSFENREQYEQFLQLRVEPCVMPCLENIAEYDGILNDTDRQQFEEVLEKLDAILNAKKEILEHDENNVTEGWY